MRKQIEIDIAVYRAIEFARIDFEETPNTILRRLLGIDKPEVSPQSPKLSTSLMPKKSVLEEPENGFELSDEISTYQSSVMRNRIQASEIQTPRDWIYGGARLPEGTKLQKWSRGQKHEAIIHNGSIFINGQYHQSPSAAAMAVNGGTSVNGWLFWEYFDESTSRWEKLIQLREKKMNDLDMANIGYRDDDKMFISNLPLQLKELGTQFLSRIRQFHKGPLIYHPKSQKYVESPNFYTIKIQPRDQSLRITIYGNPNEFNNTLMELVADMAGYSSFKLIDIGQLDAAISLVSQAKELKQRRVI
jgi:hypothetical protein